MLTKHKWIADRVAEQDDREMYLQEVADEIVRQMLTRHFAYVVEWLEIEEEDLEALATYWTVKDQWLKELNDAKSSE